MDEESGNANGGQGHIGAMQVASSSPPPSSASSSSSSTSSPPSTSVVSRVVAAASDFVRTARAQWQTLRRTGYRRRAAQQSWSSCDAVRSMVVANKQLVLLAVMVLFGSIQLVSMMYLDSLSSSHDIRGVGVGGVGGSEATGFGPLGIQGLSVGPGGSPVAGQLFTSSSSAAASSSVDGNLIAQLRDTGSPHSFKSERKATWRQHLGGSSLIGFYFDRAFVVSTASRLEAYWTTRDTLSRFQLKVERFIAVNPNTDPTVQRMWDHYRKRPITTPLEMQYKKKFIRHKSQMAQLMTLGNILRQAKQRNLNRILIVDDDVVPHRQLSQLFSSVLTNIGRHDSIDWKLLFLAVRQVSWGRGSMEFPKSRMGVDDRSKGYWYAYRPSEPMVFAIDSSVYDFLIQAVDAMEAPMHQGALRKVCAQMFRQKCFAFYPALFAAAISPNSKRRIERDQPRALTYSRYGWDPQSYERVPKMDPQLRLHRHQQLARLNKTIAPLNDWPLVSIIMTVHDAPSEYVEMAVHSALNQTYPNTELIIVDDDTSVATALVISRTLEQAEGLPVKRFVNERERGMAYSRNFAVRQSQGRFVVFFDSTHWSAPDRIERQIRPMIERVPRNKEGRTSYPVDMTLPSAVKLHLKHVHWQKGAAFVRRQVERSRKHWDSHPTVDRNTMQSKPRRPHGNKKHKQKKGEPTCRSDCCRSKVDLKSMMITREAYEVTGSFEESQFDTEVEFLERYLSKKSCLLLAPEENVLDVLDVLYRSIQSVYRRIDEPTVFVPTPTTSSMLLKRNSVETEHRRAVFRKHYRAALQTSRIRCKNSVGAYKRRPVVLSVDNWYRGRENVFFSTKFNNLVVGTKKSRVMSSPEEQDKPKTISLPTPAPLKRKKMRPGHVASTTKVFRGGHTGSFLSDDSNDGDASGGVKQQQHKQGKKNKGKHSNNKKGKKKLRFPGMGGGTNGKKKKKKQIKSNSSKKTNKKQHNLRRNKRTLSSRKLHHRRTKRTVSRRRSGGKKQKTKRTSSKRSNGRRKHSRAGTRKLRGQQ